MILPDTDRKQALKAAERVRSDIEREIWPGHPGLVVTASFGVVQYHIDLDPTLMVELADQALYLAKEQGRNRVEFSNWTQGHRSVA